MDDRLHGHGIVFVSIETFPVVVEPEMNIRYVWIVDFPLSNLYELTFCSLAWLWSGPWSLFVCWSDVWNTVYVRGIRLILIWKFLASSASRRRLRRPTAGIQTNSADENGKMSHWWVMWSSTCTWYRSYSLKLYIGIDVYVGENASQIVLHQIYTALQSCCGSRV